MNLHRLIAKRHGLDGSKRGGVSGEWALFFELPNGTGSRPQDRFVDAFAFNCWPSSGLTRVAYEIKQSRQDLIRELQAPEKRKWAMDVSHEFWFVCAHGICDKTEIPEDCGLLVATKDGEKLRVAKHAPHRAARDFKPAEVAAIARAGSDMSVFRTMRWKLSGQDLGPDDLSAIVRDEMGGEVLRMSMERAQEMATSLLAGVRARLGQYAKEMREAGVAPPEWMESGELDGAAKGWKAAYWVTRHVLKPQPEALIGGAERAIATAIEALGKAGKELAELRERGEE